MKMAKLSSSHFQFSIFSFLLSGIICNFVLSKYKYKKNYGTIFVYLQYTE